MVVNDAIRSILYSLQRQEIAVLTQREIFIITQHIDDLSFEISVLRSAIIAHRSQKADDRCIEDDDKLYTVLGDGVKCDRRVGDKAAMLLNCARYIENRCEPGGWPTYAEIEKENQQLKQKIKEIQAQTE